MSLVQRLEAVYRQERQRLFACALAVVGEAEAAEDAVHAAFERLLARDIEPQNLRSYVYQAVRNAAHDVGRRSAAQERRARQAACPYYHDDKTSAGLEDREAQEQLIAALAAIDPLRREIIELHLRADLKFREIAEMTNLPLGTVTSHYRRGIEQLRKLLSDDGEIQEHERHRNTHP
jgi:RNA polymerase sigma-70 factor (ECF subfamily)